MKKIPLEILGLSPSRSEGGSSFAIILGEVGGKRRLPIIIGMFEAQAIAIEIEKIQPSRPMTHDLFKSFAKEFDFSIEEVVIADLREGVFIAKIIGTHGKEEVEVDARPSDAIAIALRFDITIYVQESILEEAGIILDDEEEEAGGKESQEEKSPPVPLEERMRDMQVKELKKLLEQTLAKEDYETAARIRDEINRRN